METAKEIIGTLKSNKKVKKVIKKDERIATVRFFFVRKFEKRNLKK
jgi:hypothetical protein